MDEVHGAVVRRMPAAVFGLLVLLSAGASAAGTAASEGSRGWPLERAKQLPGYEYLFPISNASAPPRIRSAHYVLGELAARFWLELSDDEVLRIAKAAGALGVDRFNPLGLFRVRTPPSEVAMNRVMEELWESGAVVGYGADRKVQLLTIRVAAFGGVQLLGLMNGFDYLTLHPDFAKMREHKHRRIGYEQ